MEEIAPVSGPEPSTGMIAYFNWQLEWLQAEVEDAEGVPPYRFAQAYGALQDRDRTLSLLREVAEARSFETRWVAREIWFTFLREDPEFHEILAQLNLPIPADGSPGIAAP